MRQNRLELRRQHRLEILHRELRFPPAIDLIIGGAQALAARPRR
ncbi:hypothetical protein [Kutzneria buriramensis]|nr:hypothetical protein [Kutzneria buriramensis]